MENKFTQIIDSMSYHQLAEVAMKFLQTEALKQFLLKNMSQVDLESLCEIHQGASPKNTFKEEDLVDPF